ncbi:hypothetical protein AB0N81_08705 [Streptomyces sp. NPDC093510]|uniref:hypothetical protein n=1 Tax=Streptomyces sp. NPDC093510 TaxID=3155199 RepID=UPI003439F373
MPPTLPTAPSATPAPSEPPVSSEPSASSTTPASSEPPAPPVPLTSPASPDSPASSISPSPRVRAASPGLGRFRLALRVAAVIACVPYLVLKVAWISGSRVGIPEGSPLLDHRVLMALVNGLTVLMDASVIVLALLLTRPWGLRVPARLLLAPMWVATGLLTPIMAGYPLQLAVKALGGGVGGGSSTGEGEPFLADWVFGVVYTGFILQGITLGSLFALYARDRWGHLWQGRVRDLPRAARGARTAAGAAALLALLPVALHVAWATGSTAGLGGARALRRTADFHVLEALDAIYLVAAVTGALLLVFRSSLPVRVPLTLAWLGSGAVGCWGAWLLLGSLAALGDATKQPTGPMLLTYAVHMIIGTIVAVLMAGFLKERAGTTA